MISKLLFTILIIIFNFLPAKTYAAETLNNCSDRYVTFVNPIRSRQLWHDQTLGPVKDMYQPFEKYNYAGTWLVQYDVFSDSELLNYVKGFNQKQEIGLFVEVSEQLAQDAKVFYNSNTAWYHPEVIFFSAYSQSERRRLIDKYFSEFKNNFGYYPKSVGAWWIDSYSLKYMEEKYGISSVMIVADQLSTDRYGVWGQWWGVPYIPSKANVLVPAQSLEDKLNVSVIQWAQRHGEKAYGDTPKYSNFSLQANDYIRLGHDTEHFKNLVSYYLQCSNSIGQITIGLEVGQESIEFIDEYYRQLDYLNSVEPLESVTMSMFSEIFLDKYPSIIESAKLESSQSAWVMNTYFRENDFLKDKVFYQANTSFADYFIADKSGFLDRKLSTIQSGAKQFYAPIFILVVIGVGGWFMFKKQVRLFLISTLLLFSMFGLMLKSNAQYSWTVYFGPVLDNLMIWQIFITSIFYGIVFWLSRKVSQHSLIFLFYSILTTFGFAWLISLVRYTVSEQGRIFGLSFDGFSIFGIAINRFDFYFGRFDFPANVAGALKTVPFLNVYQNPFFYLLLMPVLHIILGVLIWFLIKRFPRRLQFSLLFILLIPFLFYFWQFIIVADPLAVR